MPIVHNNPASQHKHKYGGLINVLNLKVKVLIKLSANKTAMKLSVVNYEPK